MTLLGILGTLVVIGVGTAVAILVLAVVVWSFHVSFIAGLIALLFSTGIPVIPILVVILPFIYR